ncbi:MAG: GFA family protein [Pseudomonadota bacterium]
MKVKTGGCLCGEIKFEVSGDPVLAMECHCGACQKSCGGHAAPILVFPKPALKILQGEMAEFTSDADSGNTVTRQFCSTCGTPMMSKLSANPDLAVIKVGAFDDASDFDPQMVFWTSTAQPWAHIPDGTMQFPQNPPAS